MVAAQTPHSLGFWVALSVFPPDTGVGRGDAPSGQLCPRSLRLCQAGCFPGKVLVPLTLLPVAEGVPGLTQVVSGAVVHDAHPVSPAAGVGVGCGVSSRAVVQPPHQAQVESHLADENRSLD